MVGIDITNEKGIPTAGGKKLSPSAYQPSSEVKTLFARCMTDYQVAWRLQHRPFDEFDGVSLLQRAKTDQQTFGAYVGAQYVAQHKAWRWRGRKNTARNKIIALLAHLVSGMLYPLVRAQNMENEEDKTTGEAMRIIIEEHLRKAGYQHKFLYMCLSALVNPAVLVEVKYYVAYQRIKEQLASGAITVIEAVDTLLTGLNLNIIPIDQLLISDFFINDIQRQPYVVRIDRISWDQARKIYGHHEDFQYVEAGKTRIVVAGNEHATLYDIEWTEADRLAVQVLTFYYRDEDLEVTFVGGVFMGNKNNIYNSNRFTHRRMSLIGDSWYTIPFYPFAKSGLEPLDPAGRFFYCKSIAFKEFWDDATQNKMHQLLIDGAHLEVIKPILVSGITKADSTVIAPGSVIGAPQGSQFTPWSMNSNLPMAVKAMDEQKTDIADSTLSAIMQGQLGTRQTAFAVNAALTNAKILLGLSSFMIADLIRQIGELTVDCVVQYTTQGELDATLPESLNIKYRTLAIKSQKNKKDINNIVVFKSNLLGKKFTETKKNEYEWKLWDEAGGGKNDVNIYHINPYRFARTVYSLWVDPDAITSAAIGLNRDKKMEDIKLLTQPFVYPFTDPEAIANEIIEEAGGDNPDKFKKKGQGQGADMNDMLSQIMGKGAQESQPNPGAVVPAPQLVNK